MIEEAAVEEAVEVLAAAELIQRKALESAEMKVAAEASDASRTTA
jgi:hypothetical protein